MNLKQLAKELNLSVSAVSKALRDSHEISQKTKAIVLAKAKELNYQVNPFASSLRKQKSKTIAVVIPEIDNNFFALAIKGVETIAQEKGYHVLIYLTHEDIEKEKSVTNLLQNGRVDGVMISVSSQTKDIKHLQNLMNNDIPIVFFDRVAEKIDAPKITTDDYQSGINATEHLIENESKKIAFLSISDELSICKERLRGYMDALKKNKIKIDESLIIDCNQDKLYNKKILTKLLRKKNRPNGIFASVEKLALAAYEVCHELDLKIPEDLKIIGFSNLRTASLLNPSLSTITQPAYEIGREAASLLFAMVEKRGYKMIPENTVIPSTINARKSTQKI